MHDQAYVFYVFTSLNIFYTPNIPLNAGDFLGLLCSPTFFTSSSISLENIDTILERTAELW